MSYLLYTVLRAYGGFGTWRNLGFWIALEAADLHPNDTRQNHPKPETLNLEPLKP